MLIFLWTITTIDLQSKVARLENAASGVSSTDNSAKKTTVKNASTDEKTTTAGVNFKSTTTTTVKAATTDETTTGLTSTTAPSSNMNYCLLGEVKLTKTSNKLNLTQLFC